MATQQKILVIGATGTVSAGAIPTLLAQGHSVRAATRSPKGKKSEAGLEWIEFEATDRKSVERAFEGVDRAFLLSPPGYADQHAMLSPLIAEAKKRGLKKVVLMTAAGVEANPASPFRRAEIELEQSGLKYNIVRPNWFMQNFNTFWIHGINTQKKIALPAADAKVAFIDSRDISDVVAKLLTDDTLSNQAFNLSGPEALTHAQAASGISEGIGARVTYDNIEPETFKQGLIQVGLPADYAALLTQLFEFVRLGYSAGTTDGVEKVTGHKPRGFQQYVRDFKKSWT